VTITIAINVNGGTQGWLLNDLRFGEQAAAAIAGVGARSDGARRAALRSSMRGLYQAFLDAMRM
jgi:hypothetical protein